MRICTRSAWLFGICLALINSCGGGGGGSSHTALCNDGTYSDSQNCSGTCSSHGGVREWYVACGSASVIPLTIGGQEVPGQEAGVWFGTWVDSEENESGTLRLHIGEDGLVNGMFFNGDNTIDSELHSQVDSDGIKRVFLDAQSSSVENVTVEHPVTISLNNVNDQLVGTITILTMEGEQIREVKLGRE